MRVFYKYSKCETLEPISGDRITEIMNIKAMKRAGYEVKYNGKIAPGERAAAYIRANDKYFRQAEGLKRIWFASPYNEFAMTNADRIATFSDTWTDMLRLGVKFNLNPSGIAWGEKVITFPQTIEDDFFRQTKQNTGHLFFCITGKISDQTYPDTFMKIWPIIRQKYRANLILVVNNIKDKYYVPPDATVMGMPHSEMPKTLSNMSLMIAGQHGEEWEFCGNMKILEAAAVGLPVIMERSKARELDFGFEYPLFVPRGTMTEPGKVRFLHEAIERFIEEPEIAKPWLKLAAFRHRIDHTSKVIGGHLSELL